MNDPTPTQQTPRRRGKSRQSPQSLQEEIEMVRAVMDLVMAKAQQSDKNDLTEMIRLLNAISNSAARLTTLIRAQHDLEAGATDEVAANLIAALEEMGYGAPSH